MNVFTITQLPLRLGAIEAAGIPALRTAFTLAIVGFVAIGTYIYRRRHQLFDRDPEVDNDVTVVRHIRFENIAFVWAALMIVLVCICVAAWRA
jgi:hypothetical protein